MIENITKLFEMSKDVHNFKEISNIYKKEIEDLKFKLAIITNEKREMEEEKIKLKNEIILLESRLFSSKSEAQNSPSFFNSSIKITKNYSRLQTSTSMKKSELKTTNKKNNFPSSDVDEELTKFINILSQISIYSDKQSVDLNR